MGRALLTCCRCNTPTASKGGRATGTGGGTERGGPHKQVDHTPQRARHPASAFFVFGWLEIHALGGALARWVAATPGRNSNGTPVYRAPGIPGWAKLAYDDGKCGRLLLLTKGAGLWSSSRLAQLERAGEQTAEAGSSRWASGLVSNP
jgi:hypothetical protein